MALWTCGSEGLLAQSVSCHVEIEGRQTAARDEGTIECLTDDVTADGCMEPTNQPLIILSKQAAASFRGVSLGMFEQESPFIIVATWKTKRPHHQLCPRRIDSP